MTHWSLTLKEISHFQKVSMVSVKVTQSTQTSLNHMTLTRLLDYGLPVDVILLDQAKAFDKVQHQFLVLKLEAYRVHEGIVA